MPLKGVSELGRAREGGPGEGLRHEYILPVLEVPPGVEPGCVGLQPTT